MFLLMPFWSREGGMTVPYAPGGIGPLKELELVRDKMYPFADVKLAKEILFEGDPDNAELNYGNKPPKFRVWTKGWTDAQWDFFLNLLEEIPDSQDGSIKVPKYPQFGGKLFYTPKPYDILPGSDNDIDEGWVYPIKALEWLVKNEKIIAPSQIQYIMDRKEKERKARLKGKVSEEWLEEIKQEEEEAKKTKAQILPSPVAETLETFDPQGEFKEVEEDLVVENIGKVLAPEPVQEPVLETKKTRRGAGGKFVGAK